MLLNLSWRPADGLLWFWQLPLLWRPLSVLNTALQAFSKNNPMYLGNLLELGTSAATAPKTSHLLSPGAKSDASTMHRSMCSDLFETRSAANTEHFPTCSCHFIHIKKFESCPGTVFAQVLWRNFFILNNGRTTARPSDVKEVENAPRTTLSIPFTSLSFHSLRLQSFETSIFVASFLQEWSDPANIDSVFQSSGVFLVALAVNAFQRLGWYFIFMKHSQHLSRRGHFQQLLHSLSKCSCSKCFIRAFSRVFSVILADPKEVHVVSVSSTHLIYHFVEPNPSLEPQLQHPLRWHACMVLQPAPNDGHSKTQPLQSHPKVAEDSHGGPTNDVPKT